MSFIKRFDSYNNLRINRNIHFFKFLKYLTFLKLKFPQIFNNAKCLSVSLCLCRCYRFPPTFSPDISQVLWSHFFNVNNDDLNNFPINAAAGYRNIAGCFFDIFCWSVKVLEIKVPPASAFLKCNNEKGKFTTRKRWVFILKVEGNFGSLSL